MLRHRNSRLFCRHICTPCETFPSASTPFGGHNCNIIQLFEDSFLWHIIAGASNFYCCVWHRVEAYGHTKNCGNVQETFLQPRELHPGLEISLYASWMSSLLKIAPLLAFIIDSANFFRVLIWKFLILQMSTDSLNDAPKGCEQFNGRTVFFCTAAMSGFVWKPSMGGESKGPPTNPSTRPHKTLVMNISFLMAESAFFQSDPARVSLADLDFSF